MIIKRHYQLITRTVAFHNTLTIKRLYESRDNWINFKKMGTFRLDVVYIYKYNWDKWIL